MHGPTALRIVRLLTLSVIEVIIFIILLKSYKKILNYVSTVFVSKKLKCYKNTDHMT